VIKMGRFVVGVLLGLASVSGSPRSAAAKQFQIPLPTHFPAESVRAYLANPCDFESDPARRSAGIADRCRYQRWPVPTRLWPRDNVPVDTLFSGAFGAFEQLAGGVSADENLRPLSAFLYSTLLAANAGNFRFNLSYMHAVSAADSSTTSATDSLRNAVRRVARLVFNGGEEAMRFIVPWRAGGGINWQSAAGAYLSIGRLGKFEEGRSSPVTLGVTVEWIASLALRDRQKNLVAELLTAFRPGLVALPFSSEGILFGYPEQVLPYGQFFFGLRRSGRLSYSATVTVVPKRLSPYVPDVQVVAQSAAF
jgi:hypothetical protein